MNQNFFEPQSFVLEAIIYAEFDNEIGRVIKHQVPHEIFDKQHFDAISFAIIPSEEMRDRMIKINMYNYKIMGHPVGIKDKQYAREIFIFNMCFIVSKTSQFDIIYGPLVQKCAEYLVELEKEQKFLSKKNDKLPILMQEIFYGLNNKGECIYTVTEQTTIYLKLCPSFHGKDPPAVNPFLVPIFTCISPPTSFEQLNKMDVLSQKICPQIDGVKCIKDISYVVQIDADLVSRCIQNLCFYGCIALLPMFLYSNTYITCERIQHILKNSQIIEKCLTFVRLKDDEPPVKLSDLSRLYLSLKRGITLREWCIKMQPRELNVDERKFIQFGVYYKFVRKVLIYPVASGKILNTKIGSYCNGETCLEDLALRYSCSPIDIHKNLLANGNFIFITR